MPDNIQRTKGRGAGYKFDRGGTPAESGPFIGVVKNNVDPTRSGRLQVFIRQFSGTNEDDESLWRTVSYIPPFYGSTAFVGSPQGPGTFVGNQQSYGMWFTPPDIGVSVICFFIEGDPNQGYYVGCVPDPGINHMVPAIGASTTYSLGASGQENFLRGARQLPVTEINADNPAIAEDPRFFAREKPVHSVVAAIMFQQGLINDTVRGPITSNSQRESPSAVYGVSTPGRAIYQGGLSDIDIQNRLNSGAVRPQDIEVIGRRGGHSVVLDDGNLEGKDNLIRIRTAKGHQITMSDDGDCFYITHANGQTWIELGKQGTVDVFSTNSVNVRTQGTINLHADRDINMYAGGSFNVKSQQIKIQSEATLDLISKVALTVYGSQQVGIKSNGSVNVSAAKSCGINGGSSMSLKAGCINLNGGGSPGQVLTPKLLTNFNLADTEFNPQTGWQVTQGTLKTIVTRAPTHEPYPYHNQGVNNFTQLGTSGSSGGSLTALAGKALSTLTNVLPSGVIDAASFLTQDVSVLDNLGSLGTSQITGLLTQASKFVNQDFNVVSVVNGLGKYGLNAEQLETAGFLKPGTVQQFLSNPNDLVQVLSSPSVWTGRAGVNSLSSILSDVNLQDIAQQEVMSTALTGLQKAGLVTGNELPKDLAPILQTAAKFNVNTAVEWAQGRLPPELSNVVAGYAKGAQYAVDFVDTKMPEISAGGLRLGGFIETTARSSLDDAVASIINNPKIPVPNFGGGLYNNTPDADLTYSGNDPIILERINAERVRRGLPPLGSLTA